MKFRIIPAILTNGNTVVKGQNFDNWRTVGNAQATALLYSSRNVDELMFLDVRATQQSRVIDPQLIQYFSSVLNVPFSVGGGIRTLEDARTCMRAGAEKVVIGTAAIENPRLISQIATEFGSQAVTVSIDVLNENLQLLATHSGTRKIVMPPAEFASLAIEHGAGELLIQSIERDGKMCGASTDTVREIALSNSVPVIASGGICSAEDIKNLAESGARAVAVGALFQFTQNTPSSLAIEIAALGIETRLL